MCCPEEFVCNCDMFSVVNVHLEHLKFCVECNVAPNDGNEPTSRLVQPIGTHGGEVMYFGCVCSRGALGLPISDVICLCVVNKQPELLEFAL